MIDRLDSNTSIDLANGPVAFANAELIENLRREEAYGREGKTARTMLRSRALTLVLTVLRQGSSLDQHKAPGPIHVMTLEGELEFAIVDGESFILKPMQSVAVPAAQMHAVKALSDCAFIITIGGKE